MKKEGIIFGIAVLVSVTLSLCLVAVVVGVTVKLLGFMF